MGQGDSVSLHRDAIKIEGGRNLYNYTFTLKDTTFQDLVRVVELGDAARVRAFLEKHPHVPLSVEGEPFTPLHFAAKGGNAEVVKALVERGAPLDLEDGEHQSTPLGWAAFFGQPAAAEALLRAGARVTANSLYNARAGIEGRLSEISDASPDSYRAVLALLEKGQPPA